MSNLKMFIQKHALPVYFFLAFAWTWICWLPLIIATPPGGMQAGISPVFFIVAILGGFGPSLAGFVVAAMVGGKAGAKDLWKQAGRWRMAPGWYVIALLLVPAVSLVALAIHSALLQKTLAFGDIGSSLALGLIWPLFSSIGEEFGWRGFALRGLQKSHAPLVAGLLVGLLWGLWHLPADFIAMRHYGWLFIPYFLLAGPINLTVQALIMTWIYNRSGSLLPVILYHYSITSSAIILPSLQLSPLENIAGMSISVLLFSILALGITFSTQPGNAARILERDSPTP